MENRQTAVEWLAEQIRSDQNQKALTPTEWMGVIEQAKQMEKELIAKAWDDGDYAHFYSKETGIYHDNGEQYYNETYGDQTNN